MGCFMISDPQTAVTRVPVQRPQQKTRPSGFTAKMNPIRIKARFYREVVMAGLGPRSNLTGAESGDR